MEKKEYKINIDPRILELLGPSLYTNIYYILAELVANAYDADAHNVYIIADDEKIIVEDDGEGMSYSGGDIKKYLNVAAISRNSEEDSLTPLGRKKMGRKGVGKLAALSVSENVLVKTISNGEKSGFVLSRYIADDNQLIPLEEEEINFEKITGNGTSIVMMNPQYKLHSTLKTIKRNLLKIFPLVNKNFIIHIMQKNHEEIIQDFDRSMISELSALITIGDNFNNLIDLFDTSFKNEKSLLVKAYEKVSLNVEMKDKVGVIRNHEIEIRGWIGTYLSTRGRKAEMTDFPDNFISLYANNKLGEFNILPLVGQNKLNEVFVVGQLHVDAFEITELPDMALSNRQGYKSDDPRYIEVLNYTKNQLLPEILKMRDIYVSLSKREKKINKLKEQKNKEDEFKESVDKFRKNTERNTIDKLTGKIDKDQLSVVKDILTEEINSNSPDMGIKSIIDSQKRKILISQTSKDKDLADIVYSMLLFNNVPPEDIIYTNCDSEVSRIPEGDVGKSGIYQYLRNFFVDSYSTQKIYVIFITSHDSKKSWGALTEVGAAWITQVEHKIFNIYDFRPEHPLDDESTWHSSQRDSNNNLYMNKLGIDIFSQKIEYICNKLGYPIKDRKVNQSYLETLVLVKND